MSPKTTDSVSRPVDVSVLASGSRSWSWFHIGWIDECLGLGLKIKGLVLGIGLVHIPAYQYKLDSTSSTKDNCDM